MKNGNFFMYEIVILFVRIILYIILKWYELVFGCNI